MTLKKFIKCTILAFVLIGLTLVGIYAGFMINCLYGKNPTPPDDLEPARNPAMFEENTYEHFIETADEFTYQTDEDRVSLIVASYPDLAIGMGPNEVAGILGVPDVSQRAYGPKGPGETFIGWSWDYYLSNTTRAISIFFNSDAYVNWIIPNIEGLEEKGGHVDGWELFAKWRNGDPELRSSLMDEIAQKLEILSPTIDEAKGFLGEPDYSGNECISYEAPVYYNCMYDDWTFSLRLCYDENGLFTNVSSSD